MGVHACSLHRKRWLEKRGIPISRLFDADTCVSVWFAKGLEITLKVTHIAGDLGPTDLKVCIVCIVLKPFSWCQLLCSTHTVFPTAGASNVQHVLPQRPHRRLVVWLLQGLVVSWSHSLFPHHLQDFYQVLGKCHPAANVLPGQSDPRKRAQCVQPTPLPQLPCMGRGAHFLGEAALFFVLQYEHVWCAHRRSITSRSNSTKPTTRYVDYCLFFPLNT